VHVVEGALQIGSHALRSAIDAGHTELVVDNVFRGRIDEVGVPDVEALDRELAEHFDTLLIVHAHSHASRIHAMRASRWNRVGKVAISTDGSVGELPLCAMRGRTG
jgi:nucleoside-diphosphate-sugar epimerase